MCNTQLAQGAQRLHPNDSPHDARQRLPHATTGAGVSSGRRHVTGDVGGQQRPAAAAAAAAATAPR